jgi:hypothetical protein
LLEGLHSSNTFWVEIYVKQGFLPKKTYFRVSHTELILTRLDTAEVALVDVEPKQVETGQQVMLS